MTFDRSPFTHKEKQVDIALSTTMLEDSFTYMKAANGDTAVLAGGDGDFLPTIESLQARGLRVRVVSGQPAPARHRGTSSSSSTRTSTT